MCEFCIRHGDGKKWYLNAANYAEELLQDVRRAKYIEEFIPDITSKAGRWLKILDRGRQRSPALTARLSRIQSRRMKAVHYGQILPIEDVQSILAIVGEVVRLPCVCREVLEKKQEAVCYLLMASPDSLGLKELIGRREESLPFVEGMERVDADEALSQMKSYEGKGMVHSVWTFHTPFIGGLCNCDPRGCLAMNFTERGLPLYLPGEEKAVVDEENCSGCGACEEICIFDAVAAAEDGTAVIDSDRCQGCGICRGACETDAIALRPQPAAVSP